MNSVEMMDDLINGACVLEGPQFALETRKRWVGVLVDQLIMFAQINMWEFPETIEALAGFDRQVDVQTMYAEQVATVCSPPLFFLLCTGHLTAFALADGFKGNALDGGSGRQLWHALDCTRGWKCDDGCRGQQPRHTDSLAHRE